MASKGESSIHVYEMNNGTNKPRECSKASIPGGPMCGFAWLPKNTCNTQNTEVTRAFHATSTSIQNVTFKVPRAAKLSTFFHDDIYPDTRDLNNVKFETEQFFNSEDAMPDVATMSLNSDGMVLLSEKPEEKRSSNRPKASTYLEAERKEEERKKTKDAQFKRLEALAHQHAKYNANKSMGSRKIKGERERVAARDAADADDSSDSGWSDEDE